METASFILIGAACILIAMAIECLIKSTALLNVFTFLLLIFFAVISGSWGLSEFFSLIDYTWYSSLAYKFLNAAFVLSAFTILVFSFYFPKDKSNSQKPLWVLILLFLTIMDAVIIFFGLDRNSFELLPINGTNYFFAKIGYNWLYYIGVILSAGMAGFGFYKIIDKYRKARLLYQKKQIRYFLTGTIFFCVLILLAFQLKTFLPSIMVSIFRAMAFVGAGGITLYSVISYRFVNLRKKSFIWMQELIFSLIAAVPLSALLFITNLWLINVNLSIYLSIMAPVLILFVWLSNQSGILIKKYLNIPYRSKDITEIFLDRIGPSHNLQELAKNTIDTLLDTVNCRYADFLRFDRETDAYTPVFSSVDNTKPVSAIHPFFRYIQPDIELYDQEQIEADPRFAFIRDLAEKYFKIHEAAVLIPIYYDKNLFVLIHLSGKMDGTAYTAAETILLTKLKKIVRIVMNNIILFESEQDAKVTKRDLSLASEIQDSVFQKNIPVFSKMDVYGYQKPAKGVSGDYFLIEKVSDNSFGFLVADVSGKGFSAALMSMVIHTIAKSQEFSSTTTNAIVSKINEIMTLNQEYTQITKVMSFATVFCGFIDQKNETLYYTNAGHHPMIVHDEKEGFSYIKSNSKPAGIFPDEKFPTQTYNIHSGQVFVLYSDGITEAINSEEEEFGTERLEKIIKKNKDKSAKEISDTIISEIEDFYSGQEQFDDITLIVIKL